MPWIIRHRCHMLGPDRAYGQVLHERNGQKLTEMLCPDCGENFFIVGDELFRESVSSEEAGNMPKGFLFPQSTRRA